MRDQRTTFVITLRADPHVADPIRSLRWALKVLGRRFGLRAIEIREHHGRHFAVKPTTAKHPGWRSHLSVEKRAMYLQRIAAMLELRGRFSDADVADVAKLARTGLAHPSAA
jgi:hypothetical protein